MPTFVVRRRGIAAAAHQLDAALTQLRDAAAHASAPARWLHSYAVREPDGRFGLLCLFEADDAQALRDHAASCGLPADELQSATGTWVERGFAPVQVFLVRRRRGWRDAAQFAQDARSANLQAADDPAGAVVWLRSYTVREDDGRCGSWCLYQARSPQTLQAHAARALLPLHEITPVLGRVVFR